MKVLSYIFFFSTSWFNICRILTNAGLSLFGLDLKGKPAPSLDEEFLSHLLDDTLINKEEYNQSNYASHPKNQILPVCQPTTMDLDHSETAGSGVQRTTALQPVIMSPPEVLHRSPNDDHSDAQRTTFNPRSILWENSIPRAAPREERKRGRPQGGQNIRYDLVDFKPNTMSDVIAVGAIGSLKQSNGEKLFNTDNPAHLKRIQLRGASTLRNSFFAQTTELIHEKKKRRKRLNENNQLGHNSLSNRSNLEINERIDSALEKFETSPALSITFYRQKKQQFSEFKEFHLGQAKIPSGEKSPFFREQLERWYYTEKILPVYLFLVDIINFIFPKEQPINQTLLEREHTNAINLFLEQMYPMTFTLNSSTNPLKSELIRRNNNIISTDFNPSDKKIQLIWSAVKYWLSLSRKELLSYTRRSPIGSIPSEFKHFCHDLLVSFTEEVRSVDAKL